MGGQKAHVGVIVKYLQTFGHIVYQKKETE